MPVREHSDDAVAAGWHLFGLDGNCIFILHCGSLAKIVKRGGQVRHRSSVHRIEASGSALLCMGRNCRPGKAHIIGCLV